MPLGVDLDQGDVELLVPPLHLAPEFPAVGEFHLYLVGPLHHMVVGDEVTVVADDEA